MSRLLGSTAFAAALAFAAPAALTPVAAWAATMTFHATLNGASEVPPTTSTGTGEGTATLNTSTRVLKYTLSFSGLTGAATMAHIHGPAAPGANAGVVVPLGNNPTSPISGSKKLTAAQVKELEAGMMYMNVHTAANPGGEIRGQLTKG